MSVNILIIVAIVLSATNFLNAVRWKTRKLSLEVTMRKPEIMVPRLIESGHGEIIQILTIPGGFQKLVAHCNKRISWALIWGCIYGLLSQSQALANIFA